MATMTALEVQNFPEGVVECWNGDNVMPPMANDEHQGLAFGFAAPLFSAVVEPKLGLARLGVNVSDGTTPWWENYRCPDVVVYLSSNPAKNQQTHWVGGPDFLVEIMSDDEDPLAKLDFYASIGTREVLIVERDPWALELFRLTDGTLASTGRCEVDSDRMLSSESLGLTFRLDSGSARLLIEVGYPANALKWLI